jgi:hypothetical protein
MTNVHLVALTISLLTCSSLAQPDTYTFRANVNSAFVWGQDVRGGATSSTIQDPLTGTTILKLSYNGMEISSRMGFERLGRGRAGEFISYTSTIANNTGSVVSVQYGGTSIDGHAASPATIIASGTKVRRIEQKNETDLAHLDKLHCFTSGFLSKDTVVSGANLQQQFHVAPGAAFTVSAVVKDPRNYSVRCSVNGCYPTGVIRYYLRVGGHDYVFLWPGGSVVYCGE